jgi:hypothetical protein
MLSEQKVENIYTPGASRRVTDTTYFSTERAYAHSAREAPTEQDEAAILETPRTLTFVELQTLIEQGKTDEIPNNKHIPDAINVLWVCCVALGDDVLSIHYRRPLPVSQRPHRAKSPGSSHDVRARYRH